MLGKIEGRRRGGQQRIRCLNGITDMASMDINGINGREFEQRCLNGITDMASMDTNGINGEEFEQTP